jgi:heme exporter protein D
VPQFREAWLLLQGLTSSARILFWTCAVIMFITYIFAVFGMVLISKEIHEAYDIAMSGSKEYDLLTELLEFVGNLPVFMRTLIQILTMDSWNDFLRKMMKFVPWCWLFFYAYIAVAVFVLMNLVTAIIVENAVTNSKNDEEQQLKAKEKTKKNELKDLEHLFQLMDADGSGTLSWDEFKAAFDDPEMTKKWKLLDFEPDECKELFGLLDDGDGEIETGEFF